MSFNPQHLRIGNWIHRKGSSAYGIVNGKLLALLEEDEKERDRFEYIELSGDLLERIGFIKEGSYYTIKMNGKRFTGFFYEGYFASMLRGERYIDIYHLHHLQNVYFAFCLSELPLPESAKIIPQTINS